MKTEKEIQEEIDGVMQILILNTTNLRYINDLQARLRGLYWVLEKTEEKKRL